MNETKAAVTVAEMARMVGLSRARFYQLMGSIFPEPSRDSETGRPFYDEDQQRICLEVRRRNCGINGRPVLFYSRGNKPLSSSPRPKRAKRESPNHTDLVQAIHALGLTTATGSQVDSSLKELFLGGTSGMDQAEVIRAVFVHIQRQNSTGNVG